MVLALHGELDLAMALRIEADVLLALHALYALRRSVIFPIPRSGAVSRGIPETLPRVKALPDVCPEAPVEAIPLTTAFPVTLSGFTSEGRAGGLPDGFAGSATAAAEAVETQEKTMLIDLRHVTFMDCSGLDLLCRLRDQVTARGGRLALMNLRPIVIRLLKLAALREPFELIGQADDGPPGA